MKWFLPVINKMFGASRLTLPSTLTSQFNSCICVAYGQSAQPSFEMLFWMLLHLDARLEQSKKREETQTELESDAKSIFWGAFFFALVNENELHIGVRTLLKKYCSATELSQEALQSIFAAHLEAMHITGPNNVTIDIRPETFAAILEKHASVDDLGNFMDDASVWAKDPSLRWEKALIETLFGDIVSKVANVLVSKLESAPPTANKVSVFRSIVDAIVALLSNPQAPRQVDRTETNMSARPVERRREPQKRAFADVVAQITRGDFTFVLERLGPTEITDVVSELVRKWNAKDFSNSQGYVNTMAFFILCGYFDLTVESERTALSAIMVLQKYALSERHSNDQEVAVAVNTRRYFKNLWAYLVLIGPIIDAYGSVSIAFSSEAERQAGFADVNKVLALCSQNAELMKRIGGCRERMLAFARATKNDPALIAAFWRDYQPVQADIISAWLGLAYWLVGEGRAAEADLQIAAICEQQFVSGPDEVYATMAATLREQLDKKACAEDEKRFWDRTVSQREPIMRHLCYAAIHYGENISRLGAENRALMVLILMLAYSRAPSEEYKAQQWTQALVKVLPIFVDEALTTVPVFKNDTHRNKLFANKLKAQVIKRIQENDTFSVLKWLQELFPTVISSAWSRCCGMEMEEFMSVEWRDVTRQQAGKDQIITGIIFDLLLEELNRTDKTRRAPQTLGGVNERFFPTSRGQGASHACSQLVSNLQTARDAGIVLRITEKVCSSPVKEILDAYGPDVLGPRAVVEITEQLFVVLDARSGLRARRM